MADANVKIIKGFTLVYGMKPDVLAFKVCHLTNYFRKLWKIAQKYFFQTSALFKCICQKLRKPYIVEANWSLTLARVTRDQFQNGDKQKINNNINDQLSPSLHVSYLGTFSGWQRPCSQHLFIRVKSWLFVHPDAMTGHHGRTMLTTEQLTQDKSGEKMSKITYLERKFSKLHDTYTFLHATISFYL